MTDDLIKRLRDHHARDMIDFDLYLETAAALESQQQEIAALRADAERWRAGARGHCFPEFCGHDAYAPEGASWYMPGFVEAATFATAEEAMDAHVAALSAASEGRS